MSHDWRIGNLTQAFMDEERHWHEVYAEAYDHVEADLERYADEVEAERDRLDELEERL